MTAPGTDTGPRAEIQAVDRIGQILGLFSEERVRLTTNTVAQELGLSRTTAHRYLTSMAAEDLLEPCADPAGYRLGSRILRIGGLTIGQGHAVSVAAEAMATLAAEVGTTISLSLWTAAGPVIARVQEPPDLPVVLTLRVGTVLPLDTAQSVLFLAFRPHADDAEVAVRELPEPERAVAVAKAREARRTQTVTSINETKGTWAVAAPVFDGAGICAALAIVDTLSTMSDANLPHRLARLQQTAQGLSHLLGGRMPAPRP